MPMSDYTQENLRDMMFRTDAGFTKPSELWVALFTTATSDNGTGTEVAFGSSYARVQVDPADATWSGSSATDGITDNVNDLSWTIAVSDWGTVSNAALFDQGSGGNMILHNALTASKTINLGDQFKINARNLVVTLT